MEGLFVSFDFCGHYLVFGESCLDYWASVHLMTQMRWVASICGVSKIGAARVEVSSKNKREKRGCVCVCVLTEIRQVRETGSDRVDSSSTG